MDVFLIANCDFLVWFTPRVRRSSLLRWSNEAVMTNMQPLIARGDDANICVPNIAFRQAAALLKFGEILASPLAYAFDNSSLFINGED